MRNSKLDKLYQSGCAKLMLPKTYGEMTEAVLLNTAGGITGGDRLDINIEAESGAVIVTTQTAERLYKSSTEPAKLTVNHLPRGQQHYTGCRRKPYYLMVLELDRTIDLDMSSDSRCLLAETIILGREAMGEHITDCHHR